MRIMALDLGTKTIGVALSDATGLIARGLETIRRGPIESDFSKLAKIFADKVKERFPDLEVLLWDERLSTVAAEKVLISADLRRDKRKKIIDMMAAVVILQNYLDSRQK